MGLRVILQYLLVYYIFFNCKWIEGYKKLSKEEDLKLEEQLKRLNKPAVKTIKTKFDEIYDCVDFYKQPSFDNPLLKNHNFHPKTKSTSIPRRKYPENEVKNLNCKNINIVLEDGGCPVGTVPIRRTTKDDLIRAKLYPEMYTSKINPLSEDVWGLHTAVAQTQELINYDGIGAFITVWNLPVKGPSYQYTTGRIRVVNYDRIEAGWQVNPSVYGDNRTHFYIFTDAVVGGFCFDAKCGFVQTNSKLPVGAILDPVSTYGQKYFGIPLSIRQDPVQKHWFLVWDSKQIGFWPKSLFSNLSVSAIQVEWGGEVYSQPDEPAPGMGDGRSLWGDVPATGMGDGPLSSSQLPRDASFSRNYIVLNNTVVDPPGDLLLVKDVSNYDIVNPGNVGGGDQYLLVYGGASGYIGN